MNFEPHDLDRWLATLKCRFQEEAVDLISQFEVYAAEAKFGYDFIAADLTQLPPGSRILEVGAGSFLLSCQLVRQGYIVTAIEPVGQGFSHFHRMQVLVMGVAQSQGCVPKILNVAAESISIENEFDFAFSVNVMEHVNSPEQVIKRIGASLKLGASYKFTCPNYLFPYEPHFDMLTFFCKRLTWTLLGARLLASKKVDDPQGAWDSLNWINPIRIRRVCRKIPGLEASFNKRFFSTTIARVKTDTAFAQRRSSWIRTVARILVNTRLYRALDLLPVWISPVIDCRITKN